MSKFELYQDPGQQPRWMAFRNAPTWASRFVRSWWYWKPAGAPDGKRHGPFPLKTLARLAGWLATR